MADRTFELKLRRVGNSLGIILPKEAIEALGLDGKSGETLTVSPITGGGLELRPSNAEFEEELALLRDTMKKYRNALRALAK